jgi:hypothetical protein
VDNKKYLYIGHLPRFVPSPRKISSSGSERKPTKQQTTTDNNSTLSIQENQIEIARNRVCWGNAIVSLSIVDFFISLVAEGGFIDDQVV